MSESLLQYGLAITLAISLAMDAFAVSIGLGAKHSKLAMKTAIFAAIYFGFAQGAMPLIGYLGGKSVLGLIANIAPYIACTILVVLGMKMLYETYAQDGDTNPESTLAIANNPVTTINHATMFSLAIATSIDALAAGFTLNLMSLKAYVICTLIGLITALLSAVGVFVGKASGTALEKYAEVFGGVVLVLLGLKMLF